MIGVDGREGAPPDTDLIQGGPATEIVEVEASEAKIETGMAQGITTAPETDMVREITTAPVTDTIIEAVTVQSEVALAQAVIKNI